MYNVMHVLIYMAGWFNKTNLTKTNSFWKNVQFDYYNLFGGCLNFKGSLGGSKSPGPVATECVEKILWDDFWKVMTSSIWQIGP